MLRWLSQAWLIFLLLPRGAWADSVAAQTERPDNWALVIGIEGYSSLAKLSFTRQDAKAIYDILTDPKTGLFAKERVVLLTDDFETSNARYPSKENILEWLEWLASQAKGANLLLFYFSGHGASRDGINYIFPSDFNAAAGGEREISTQKIFEILRKAGAQRQIVVLDACRGDTKGVEAGFVNEVEPEGRFDFYAAQQGSFAHEDSIYRHSVLTYGMLLGLRGGADSDGNGEIDLAELKNYTERFVEWWANQKKKNQKARFGGDFQGNWANVTIARVLKTPPAPAGTNLLIRTIPPGASIYLNNRGYGKTPRLVRNVGGKSVALRLELDGYAAYSTRVELTPGDTIRLDTIRLEKKASVTFILNTDGTVLIHGGESKAGKSVRFELKRGAYSYTATAEGYVAQTNTFSVASGDSAVVRVNLKAYATLEFAVNTNSAVALDGARSRVGERLRFEDVLPGLHSYTATAPGYVPETDTVSVAPGDSAVVRVNLKAYATLEFVVNTNSQVTLDGVGSGVGKRVRFEKVSPGVHSYTATADGFAPRTDTISIASGEVKSISVKLAPELRGHYTFGVLYGLGQASLSVTQLRTIGNQEIGCFFRYFWTRHWAVEPEFLFSTRGAAFDVVCTDANGDTGDRGRVELAYWTVQLLLQRRSGDFHACRARVYAGPYWGIPAKAEYVHMRFGRETEAHRFSVGHDAGAVIGLGLERGGAKKNKISLFLDVRAYAGLRAVGKQEDLSFRLADGMVVHLDDAMKQRNCGWSLTCGIGL